MQGGGAVRAGAGKSIEHPAGGSLIFGIFVYRKITLDDFATAFSA